MTPAIYCIENLEAGMVTRIGTYKNATSARVAIKARGMDSQKFLPVAMFTQYQVCRLHAAAEQARSALSDLLMTRDPKVYADALRALDEVLDA